MDGTHLSVGVGRPEVLKQPCGTANHPPDAAVDARRRVVEGARTLETEMQLRVLSHVVAAGRVPAGGGQGGEEGREGLRCACLSARGRSCMHIPDEIRASLWERFVGRRGDGVLIIVVPSTRQGTSDGCILNNGVDAVAVEGILELGIRRS